MQKHPRPYASGAAADGAQHKAAYQRIGHACRAPMLHGKQHRLQCHGLSLAQRPGQLLDDAAEHQFFHDGRSGTAVHKGPHPGGFLRHLRQDRRQSLARQQVSQRTAECGQQGPCFFIPFHGPALPAASISVYLITSIGCRASILRCDEAILARVYRKTIDFSLPVLV